MESSKDLPLLVFSFLSLTFLWVYLDHLQYMEQRLLGVDN